MLYTIHGRVCVKRGSRYFAVDHTAKIGKAPTITDKAATRSADGVSRLNPWDRQVANRVGHARVCWNQRL